MSSAPNIKALKELCAIKGYGIPTFQICESDPFLSASAPDASKIFSSPGSASASLVTVEVSTDGGRSGCERGYGPSFQSACEDASARTLKNWMSLQQYDGLISGILTAAQVVVDNIIAIDVHESITSTPASARHSDSANHTREVPNAQGTAGAASSNGSAKRKQESISSVDESIEGSNPVSLLHMYLTAVAGDSSPPEVSYQKINISTHACTMKLTIGSKKIESHGSSSSKVLAKRACCMEVLKLLYPNCHTLADISAAVQRDMDDRKKRKSNGGAGKSDAVKGATAITGALPGNVVIGSFATTASEAISAPTSTASVDPIAEAMTTVLGGPKYASFNETTHSFIQLRRAVADDAAAIWGLIHELAVYEREPNAVEITVDTIRRDGFSESGSKYTSPRFYVCLAVEKSKFGDQSAHETVVGMALFYPIYSTWKGSSMYLEDLIVREPHRGQGIGKSLIHAVGEITLGAGFARLQWQCLKWNEKPMAFYRSLGAEPMEEWETLRMTKPAMAKTFGGVSLASAFKTMTPNVPPGTTLGASAASSSSKQSTSSTWGSAFKSAEQLGSTLDENVDNFLKAQKGSRSTLGATVSAQVSEVDGEDNSGDEGGFSQPSRLASFVAQHVKK